MNANAELNGVPAVSISVRDNGPGLTQEQQDRIFEAFYTTKPKGTGLGMAIAMKTIEAHHGTLVAGNGKERSRVCNDPSTRATMTNSHPQTSNKPLRIVVADDEEYIRQYFSRMLPRFGHQVVGQAATGRELIELCESEKPDLVITDIQMPELSGIEAANEIAKSQSIPVIIISSQDKPKTDNPNIIDFLVKPFETDQLAAAISKAVG